MSEDVVMGEAGDDPADQASVGAPVSPLPPTGQPAPEAPDPSAAEHRPVGGLQQAPDASEPNPAAPVPPNDGQTLARFVRTETVTVSSERLTAMGLSPCWEAAGKEPTDEQVRALADQLFKALADGATPLLVFDQGREHRFVRVEEERGTGQFWIVGDLHGDILGMETVLGYLKSQRPDHQPTVVFLGDLFDRGMHGAAVLYRVLDLIVGAPGRHGFIVGNHDEGLRYDEDAKLFSSDVQPSEFADWLNDRGEDSAWRQLARAAIAFFRCAPRAVLLPDGLLIAHGGVPHTDIQPQIKDRDALDGPNMLQDFVWTRLHESAKRKIPNRTTRGCSLGVTDFDAFCSVMEEIRLPVKGMVRGHDHLETRHAFFTKYEQRPVLTINTMCYRQDGETFGAFYRPVIVAERLPGAMPVVHELKVPPELVEQFYDAKDRPVT